MTENNLSMLRRELLAKFESTFAATPIRLISKIDQEAKKVCKERGVDYDGYSGAIGDINLSSFSEGTREALYYGRHDELWKAGEELLRQEKPLYTCYDYNGTGFECLKDLWRQQFMSLDAETANFNPYIFYGGTHAFSIVTKALAKKVMKKSSKKPEILIPTPSFPPFFFQLGHWFNLNFMPGDPEIGFKSTPEQMASAGIEKMDAVYLIAVSNPSALAYQPEELRVIIETCLAKNPDCTLLLDAVYLRTLPETEAAALWRVLVDPRYRDNMVIFDSLSKTHGRTGLRSGVAFMANADLEQETTNIIQNEIAGFSYAMQAESIGLLSLVETSAIQAMAVEIANRRKAFMKGFFNQYQDYFANLDEQVAIINKGDWQGGVYLFLRLKDHVDPIDFFIETGIAGVAGNAFFGAKPINEKYIRISFGMEDVN